MKLRKSLLMMVLAVTAGCLLLLAGGGIGVAQDGYAVGDISVTPSAGACIGGTATFSGGGAPAGATVFVIMVHSPGEFPAAELGTAIADGAGNWTLTTTVPATGFGGDGQTTNITPGTYSILASDEAETFLSAGTLEVLSSCGALPSTGVPLAAAGLAGAALVASMGLFVGIRKRAHGRS